MKADSVSVIESAYAGDLPDGEWIRRLCETAWSAFGIGTGCTVYDYDFSGSKPEVRHLHTTEGAAFQSLHDVRAIATGLPLALVHELHSPSPPVAMLNSILGVRPADYPLQPHAQTWIDNGIEDCLGVRAGGQDGRGVIVSFPVTARFKRPAWNTCQALERVAAHIGAAYRLRTYSEAGATPDSASAVLTPAAKVEHLGDESGVRECSGALIDAVRRMERARLGPGREDASASLAEWRALVQGKWSVVDFVDRDGKRFILARRNELRGRDLMAITDVERQVLELVSLGHSNKYIAYELGLAPSSVAGHVKRGLRRLGLKSRAELVALRA